MKSEEIRANHIMQYTLLVMLWAFLLFGVYIVNQSNSEWSYVLLFGLLLSGLTLWLFTVKLQIDDNGITYKSGILKPKSLKWDEISEIKIGGEFDGQSMQPNYSFMSREEKMENISFNYFYFRQKDMARIIHQVLQRNSNVDIDNQVEKILRKNKVNNLA